MPLPVRVSVHFFNARLAYLSRKQRAKSVPSEMDCFVVNVGNTAHAVGPPHFGVKTETEHLSPRLSG